MGWHWFCGAERLGSLFEPGIVTFASFQPLSSLLLVNSFVAVVSIYLPLPTEERRENP